MKKKKQKSLLTSQTQTVTVNSWMIGWCYYWRCFLESSFLWRVENFKNERFACLVSGFDVFLISFKSQIRSFSTSRLVDLSSVYQSDWAESSREMLRPRQTMYSEFYCGNEAMKVMKKAYGKLTNVWASDHDKLEMSKVLFCSSMFASSKLRCKGEMYLCKTEMFIFLL